VLLDRYLSDAIEVDVDCIADGEAVLIGGVMEHVEQAGVHSGDSACCLPPHSLAPELVQELRRQTEMMARALQVRGLMNVQFAIQKSEQGSLVYVLEVNPRASRTVPFVSKATGRPLAKIAALCMAGITLAAQRVMGDITPPYYSVKEAVFPFSKFPGVDTILGPEMKSTGEVMGVGASFGEAFVKSQLAAGIRLPKDGRAFISVRDGDKPAAVGVARDLVELGFTVLATRGTAAALAAAGVAATEVNKVAEGRRRQPLAAAPASTTLVRWPRATPTASTRPRPRSRASSSASGRSASTATGRARSACSRTAASISCSSSATTRGAAG
jgi:carbamoyl-phosphate synthase large subunit